jgi:Ser/Thr protein kinase RdoA (MazF antagonist)
MMKLSIMGLGDRRFDPAGELPLAGWAHERWSHDPGSLALVRYSSNFVFTFRDGENRRFLRSAHESQRSRAQIEAEVALLRWLHDEGIPVAAPLPSRRGHLVVSVATEIGIFHAVVFAALDGDQYEIDELDIDQVHAWGAALGQLHAAIRRYPDLPHLVRPSWQDDLALAGRHLVPAEPEVGEERANVQRELAALPVNAETYGLIHFDFELDNLIWAGGTPGIIDFDDCAHHWYAADISLALRDLFDHGVKADDPRVEAFINGYRAHTPLDQAMLAHLPLFSRLQRLTGFGRLARCLDLAPDGDYQPWLRDLEGRLAAMKGNYVASLQA